MEKSKRGGQRKGAGRKPSGGKPFQIRCKPENIGKVRQYIIDDGL